MKSISSSLQAHLEGEVTSLATCWKISRRDGTVLGFTDHDETLTVEGVSYHAETGFTPSAHASSADLQVDNQEVEGVLEAGFLTEEDILAGRYDFAEVEVFQVNYQDLTQGRLIIRTGTLGEIRLHGSRFIAEMRGMSQPLAQMLGQLFSPGCRASFGDMRCKKDLAAYTVEAVVSAVTSRRVFEAEGLGEANGYFDFGKVTFTSGANEGLSMEVKEYTLGKVTLALPMPYTISPADAFSVSAGCDKSFATCVGRFANALNFRGEPHVPGLDKMLETAATRS